MMILYSVFLDILLPSYDFEYTRQCTSIVVCCSCKDTLAQHEQSNTRIAIPIRSYPIYCQTMGKAVLCIAELVIYSNTINSIALVIRYPKYPHYITPIRYAAKATIPHPR